MHANQIRSSLIFFLHGILFIACNRLNFCLNNSGLNNSLNNCGGSIYFKSISFLYFHYYYFHFMVLCIFYGHWNLFCFCLIFNCYVSSAWLRKTTSWFPLKWVSLFPKISFHWPHQPSLFTFSCAVNFVLFSSFFLNRCMACNYFVFFILTINHLETENLCTSNILAVKCCGANIEDDLSSFFSDRKTLT